jgi:hypothetical protein
VCRCRELVLAETEGGILGSSLFGHSEVGPQEVQELERVLLMRLPEAGTLGHIGRMPSVTAADESQGNLAADGVIPVQLITRERIEVEPDSPDPRLECPSGEFELCWIVLRGLGDWYQVCGITGEAEAEAIRHHVAVTGFLRSGVDPSD